VVVDELVAEVEDLVVVVGELAEGEAVVDAITINISMEVGIVARIQIRTKIMLLRRQRPMMTKEHHRPRILLTRLRQMELSYEEKSMLFG